MKNKVICSLLAPLLLVSLNALPGRAVTVGNDAPIATTIKGAVPRDKKPKPTPKPPRPKPGPQDEGDGD